MPSWVFALFLSPVLPWSALASVEAPRPPPDSSSGQAFAGPAEPLCLADRPAQAQADAAAGPPGLAGPLRPPGHTGFAG